MSQAPRQSRERLPPSPRPSVYARISCCPERQALSPRPVYPSRPETSIERWGLLARPGNSELQAVGQLPTVRGADGTVGVEVCGHGQDHGHVGGRVGRHGDAVAAAAGADRRRARSPLTSGRHPRRLNSKGSWSADPALRSAIDERSGASTACCRLFNPCRIQIDCPREPYFSVPIRRRRTPAWRRLYAMRPGLESVSTGGTPRRAVPSQPLPSRRGLSSDLYGTAANDASMMMQPLREVVGGLVGHSAVMNALSRHPRASTLPTKQDSSIGPSLKQIPKPS